MFFSSPSMDLRLMSYLLVIILLFVLFFYFRTRKILFSVLIFSILANLMFYLNRGSEVFDIYNLKSTIPFIKKTWPILNLVLLIILIFNLINHAKNKNKKKN